MEDDLEGKKGGGSFLLLFLVIVALACGLFALYLAYSSRQALNDFSSDWSEVQDKTRLAGDSVEANAEQLRLLSVRLDNLIKKTNIYSGQAQELRSQSQSAFDQMGSIVEKTQRDMSLLNKKLDEVVSRTGVRMSPTGGETVASNSSNAGAATDSGMPTGVASASAGGEYVIAKGDILSRIAKRFGLSLSALMAANPNINPNSLQIGQVINIPAGE